jgi:hypothetical protein
MQFLEVRGRLDGAAQIRFGDDLEQWRPRPVQVDPGLTGKGFMQRFAGIFFEVGSSNPHRAARAVFQRDLEFAGAHHRAFELADLVTLGQVRIEVVLTIEDRDRVDCRADRDAECHGHAHSFAIQHGQRARQREVHRAGLAVGGRAERGAGAREKLRVGCQLDVHLQADHAFPWAAHARASGCRWCQSVSV